MYCRNCGQPINEGAKFCSACGDLVTSKPETASGQANPPAATVSPRTAAPKQPQNQPRSTPPPYQPPPNAQPRYPQQPYPNPHFQQGAASPYPAAPRQSNTGLAAVTAVLALLVVIGGFLLFVKPGYRLHRADSHTLSSSMSMPEKMEDSAAAVPPSVLTETAQPGTVQGILNPTDNGQNSEPQESLIGGNYNPLEEPWALSTNERPSFSDFEWCYGQFGFVRQAPENAVLLADTQLYNGSWKAMVIYNPDDLDGIFTRELDNVSIVVDENNQVQLTIDWYLIAPDYSEMTNEEDMPDTVFSGSVTNTGLSASGPATVSLDSFWHDGERQFATGGIIPQNGVPGYLAMVRP